MGSYAVTVIERDDGCTGVYRCRGDRLTFLLGFIAEHDSFLKDRVWRPIWTFEGLFSTGCNLQERLIDLCGDSVRRPVKHVGDALLAWGHPESGRVVVGTTNELAKEFGYRPRDIRRFTFSGKPIAGGACCLCGPETPRHKNKT